MQLRRTAFVISLFLITAAVAIALGVLGGNLLVKKEAHDAKKMRASLTQSVLEHMDKLTVGGVLPNAHLMDINRRMHDLHDLLQNQTLLVFFDYACGLCQDELSDIGRLARDSTAATHIILISASNPLYLQEAQQHHGITCPVLYDEGEQLMRALGIDTYPFNIYVGPGGRVDSVIVSQLGTMDITDFLGTFAKSRP